MLPPFAFLNNSKIDSFTTLFNKLTNVGMIKSCGFFKNNESTLDNLKSSPETGNAVRESTEVFKLEPQSETDVMRKRDKGRPVEFSAIFMLRLLISYTFTGAEILAGYFRLPISKIAGVGKSTAYNFMDNPKHNWKKLLMMIAFKAYLLIQKYSDDDFSALICDDSNIHRRRAKKVELCARNYDHVEKKNTKGYLMFPIAYTNRSTSFPINLAVISTNNEDHVVTVSRTDLDRRTVGYARRQQAAMKKNEVVVELVKESLNQGFTAEYFMTDNWFTCNNDLVIDIVGLGLKYLGMDKNFTQKYLYEGKEYSVNELQHFMVKNPCTTNSDILGHTVIIVPLSKGKSKTMTENEYKNACVPAKLVWLKARGRAPKSYVFCVLIYL